MTTYAGLSNDTGTRGGNFLTIVEGTFRLKVPEGTPGAVSRVNKKGNTVSEMQFASLKGFIKSISFEDTEYGKKVAIEIDTPEGEGKYKTYSLSLGRADGITTKIWKMLPNIDPAVPVSMVLQRTFNEEKKKHETSIFISQDNINVKWHYTQATPNGIPKWEQITVKGEKVWDNTKEVEFLEEDALQPFLQKLANCTRVEVAPRPLSSKLEKPKTKEELAQGGIVGTGLNYDEVIFPEDITAF